MLEVEKPFEVAKLPIERVYRKRGALLLCGLVILFFSPLGAFVAWLDVRSGSAVNAMTELTFIMLTAPILFGLYIVSLGDSRLVIDQDGVHQRLRGKQEDYPWQQIAGTKIIERLEGGGRGATWKSQQLQIQTFDCPTLGGRANIISGIFGVRAIDLEAIVSAGVQRWGEKRRATAD